MKGLGKNPKAEVCYLESTLPALSSNRSFRGLNTMAYVATGSDSTQGKINLTTATADRTEIPTAGVSTIHVGTNVVDLKGNANAAALKVTMN